MTLNEAITLVIAAAALALSIFTYITERLRERKKATMDAYNQLQNEVLDKLRDYTPAQMRMIAENSRSQEYKAEYKALGTLLARFNQFAVGVNTGVYDIKTLRRLAGSYIGIQYNLLKPLIDRRRIRSPGVYQELEKLVNAMPDKKWKKTGEKSERKSVKPAGSEKPDSSSDSR